MRIKRGKVLGKLGLARKHNPIISSARQVWQRSYNDGCTFEKFLELSQKNCFYCGREPYRSYVRPGSNNQPFKYNGLDRIDNSISHLDDNIVPCCFDCNKAKSELSVSDFKNLIKMIYNNLKLSDEQP